MENKNVIHGTIRKFIYQDALCARFIDYIAKNGGVIVGAGVKDGKVYLLYDADSYLPLLHLWQERYYKIEN